MLRHRSGIDDSGRQATDEYRRLSWASSNVMAKVMGVTKVSNAVFPEERSAGNRCAKLTNDDGALQGHRHHQCQRIVAGTVFRIR